MSIRKAVTGDVKTIHKILNHYADKGLLLPRSLSQLYDHVRDFFVMEIGYQTNSIQGVCALGVCWEDLAEIKSLAVTEAHQGKGLGSQLVETCFDEARDLGLKNIFTLTYISDFFEGLGFKGVDKSVLPHKIWADCLKCPKFQDCDEKALMIEL